MKHIIVITTSFPARGDGSEAAGSFVRDFVEELAGQARVSVLAPGGNPGLESDAAGLRVWRYRAGGQPLSLLRIGNPLHWWPILATLVSGRSQLKALLDSGHCDHMLALWVLPSGYWARSLGPGKGVPYSTWALGSDIWSLGKIPPLRLLLRRILRGSHENFADGLLLSEAVEDIAGKPCGFLPSTRQLPVPKKDRPPKRSGRRRLAFLGRWHHNKGVDLLLEALELLDNEDWSAVEEVRLFGGGPLESQVREQAEALAKQGRPVTLGSYLDKQQAASLLAWSDFVLIPSRIESIPVIFSDAMKSRRPVISTPVGDLPRLLATYDCGLCSEEVSASAFASILSQALKRETGNFRPGIERAAGDFSLPRIVSQFLATL